MTTTTTPARIQAAIAAPRHPVRHRPQWAKTLGQAVHPAAVTEAWYDAHCPATFRPPLGTGRLRWFVACWLRGVVR